MLRCCRWPTARWCGLSVLAMLLSATASLVAPSCAQEASALQQSSAPDPMASDSARQRKDVPLTSQLADDSQLDLSSETSLISFKDWDDNAVDSPTSGTEQTSDDDLGTNPLPGETLLTDSFAGHEWFWQWLPTGLIYHSYMAGTHEPRMALVVFYETGGRTLWDATLGGRIGLLRYGDCDPLRPQGYQLDFYGAAIARLDVKHRQDLDSTDYVFGFPLTYGINEWQFKLGYAHLSSHLGDELAIRQPDTLDERINYVRDSLVCGASVYFLPYWRQYGEVGWAFHDSGGAQPWDIQFGTELSLPGPTGRSATPFLAVNAHLREENSFGGDISVQTGWLRRGEYGQTLRFGAHYFNGKSNQFEFFDNSEEQIGLGIWYDF
jgi:hypothetical protein